MRTHRIPGGEASGAIGGMFPGALTIGCPPLTGWSLWDDFIRLGSSSGDYGESRLSTFSIGSGVNLTHQTPTANTEIGILRVETVSFSTQFEGGSVGLPTSPGVYAAGLPSGVWYVAKVRAVDTAHIEFWSGFVDAHARVHNGGPTSFVGFRFDPIAPAAWQGVVYDGLVWQTVDLVALADTSWHVFAFRYLPKNEATDAAYGVQFYTIDAAGPPEWGPQWQEAGDLIVASLPTAGMTLCVGGAVTTLFADPDVAAEVDFVGVGGHARR